MKEGTKGGREEEKGKQTGKDRDKEVENSSKGRFKQ